MDLKKNMSIPENLSSPFFVQIYLRNRNVQSVFSFLHNLAFKITTNLVGTSQSMMKHISKLSFITATILKLNWKFTWLDYMIRIFVNKHVILLQNNVVYVNYLGSHFQQLWYYMQSIHCYKINFFCDLWFTKHVEVDQTYFNVSLRRRYVHWLHKCKKVWTGQIRRPCRSEQNPQEKKINYKYNSCKSNKLSSSPSSLINV